MKQLLTVLALAALAACGGNEADEPANTGATVDPAAPSEATSNEPATAAPVVDPAATPAAPADSAAAAGTATPAPAAGTDSAPASH